MSNPFVKAAIRSKFVLTSRENASQMIRRNAEVYLKIAEQLGVESSSKQVTVPPMIGVDPEMRGWSVFQIMEHNAIVNRSIASTVESLALGKEPSGASLINPKIDVLPKGLSGPEQVEIFHRSVDDYLRMVKTLPQLRGTGETPHPVFGSFDAHKWHCMLGFHLGLHLKQAEKVVSLIPR